MTAEEILERGDYLAHFNPNHDPRNGQFTSGKSSGLSAGQKKALKYGAIAVGATLAAYGAYRLPGVQSAINNAIGYSMNAGRLSLKPRKTTGRKGSSKTRSVMYERITSGIKKKGAMIKAGVDRKDIKTHRLWTTRSMNDEGIRLEAGSVLQRIITDPTVDIRGAEHAYVAATEADKKVYAGFFAALKRFRSGAEKMYTMDMTTVSEIVSPSKQQRVQTFIDMYRENPADMATKLATFNKKIYGDQYRETTEQLIKKYSNMSTHELKNKGYYIFANSWFDDETGTFAAFKKRLVDQGFNAVIDDNDMRSYIQAERPLIIFDIPHTIGDVKVSELSADAIKQNMIDWQNMRHQYLYDVFEDDPLSYILSQTEQKVN